MATHETQARKQLVKCDVCMKEVPASESKSAEASDYVAHFCGLECHEKWLKQADKGDTGSADGC